MDVDRVEIGEFYTSRDQIEVAIQDSRLDMDTLPQLYRCEIQADQLRLIDTVTSDTLLMERVD